MAAAWLSEWQEKSRVILSRTDSKQQTMAYAKTRQGFSKGEIHMLNVAGELLETTSFDDSAKRFSPVLQNQLDSQFAIHLRNVDECERSTQANVKSQRQTWFASLHRCWKNLIGCVNERRRTK